MIELILGLALLTFLFWIGFHVTGTILTATIWLFIKLPIAILICGFGLCLCFTILLIPIGIKCFKFAGGLLV